MSQQGHIPRKTHTDREYAQQLEAIRENLLLMAGRVETMIAGAVKALTTRDIKLAEELIETDSLVNQAEVEVDELCLLVLAKWQPMASDLRFITIASKMVTDLERIGDLAVNICERAIDLATMPPLKPWQDVPRMAAIVQSMVGDAIDAFVTRDATKAQAVIERDDEVDDLYTAVFREILALMIKDSATVERGIHVQSVAKWLERMGDHSTNLAEQVIFMIKAKDVRHIRKLND